VFSVCTIHAIFSLYPDLRQRHVALATPGLVPGPMTPGGTPLRTAPGGPPEKGLAGSVASPSQAETPQHMMRRSMNPYSPGPESGLVHSYLNG